MIFGLQPTLIILIPNEKSSMSYYSASLCIVVFSTQPITCTHSVDEKFFREIPPFHEGTQGRCVLWTQLCLNLEKQNKISLRCISCGLGVGYLRNPKDPLSWCLIEMNEKPVTDHVERFTALATGQVER